VLTPKDSEFDALLDRDYPSLGKIPGLQDLQSKMILVQKPKVRSRSMLFVIKWKLKSPGQAPTESYSSYMAVKTPGHFLPTGVVLAPSETRLLSPWFSLSKLQYANVQRTNAPADTLAAFLHLNINDVTRDTRILGTTVDGVVFGGQTLCWTGRITSSQTALSVSEMATRRKPLGHSRSPEW